MNKTSDDSVPAVNLRNTRLKPAPSSASDGSGTSSEMRRQMEAAKERMKRYHAVYGQAAHDLGANRVEPTSRTEDR